MDVEDACLYCSQVVRDGRAYCSDECERFDGAPSASSASSSAFSSPNLNPARTAQDVPALVPSALGRALRRASAYSHSASSDDDDEHRVYLAPGPAKRAPLVYVRRPSATNRRSTIPLLVGGPTAPTRSSDLDDDASEPASPPAPRKPRLVPSPARLAPAALTDAAATVTKRSEARRRNRTSLPPHFQLLAPAPAPAPPVCSSSTSTRTCVSSASSTSPASPEITDLGPRPRGRRREAGEPCVADGRIRSCSRDRRRPPSADADTSEVELEWDGSRPAVAVTERGRWRDASQDAPPASRAPGYGLGRSGLRDRERARGESPLPRGRPMAVRT